MSGRRNSRLWLTAGTAVAIILVMLGLTAASVPLYDIFCRVSGYGGTTQRAVRAPGMAADGPLVTVFFDASTAPDLPWRFRPAQGSLAVHLGEQMLAFFEAENLSNGPVVGRAVYNVTPHKVGPYFAKLACFCFDEQTLEPHQKLQMPVSFFVDPALVQDASTEEVRQITLSYTFFIDLEATKALRQKRATPQS